MHLFFIKLGQLLFEALLEPYWPKKLFQTKSFKSSLCLYASRVQAQNQQNSVHSLFIKLEKLHFGPFLGPFWL